MVVRRLTGLGLLIGIFGAVYQCAPDSFPLSAVTSDELSGVYVAKVEKDVQVPFFNRFARPNYHVVVTPKPVDGAIESAYVPISPGRDLAFVETQSADGESIPGELTRIGDIRIVTPNLTADMHQYGGIPQHSAEFLSRELTLPREMSRPVNLGPTELATLKLTTIGRAELEPRLMQLSGAVPAIIAGKAVNIAERRGDEFKNHARTWLRQEYEKLGYSTSLDIYGSGALGTNANVVAEKKGRDPSKYIMVTSHLDSVGNPGADDNGAGTVSVLAVADVLAKIDLNYSVKFVAFDQEELGLVGSRAYAKRHDLKDLIAVVNVEMTSFDSDGDGAIHVMDCNENQSPKITGVFRSLLEQTARGLKIVPACTNRSDHASFWRYNKPAVIISQNFFGGDDNPCYHRSCDKVDKVDYGYMARMTNLVAEAVYSLAMTGI